jgi:hypothetical protein
MVTNPGGVVDPADLVGRDRELDRLVRAINTGGAKLLGDRRMGKTSLLNKLAKDLRAAGHGVIRISAEATDAAQFSREMIAELERSPHLNRHLAHWKGELGGEVKVGIGPAGLVLKGTVVRDRPPEIDLFHACAAAAADLRPYRLVFIFDEITALATKLAESDPAAPEAFLRSLRVPRQQLDGIAMVMAGSVGLHHVLVDKSPVNDLDGIRVGPLAPGDALYLTRCLLRGAAVAPANEQAIGEVIVEQTCAIPFYIHKLVQELSDRAMHSPDERQVVAVVDEASRDDLWEIRHYIDRIPGYYKQHADTVLLMLDEYAEASEPLKVEDICARLAVRMTDAPDRNTVLALVVRLEDDHYLTRVGRADRFATSLLRRAWLELRRP